MDTVILRVERQVFMEEKLEENGAGLEHCPGNNLHRKPVI